MNNNNTKSIRLIPQKDGKKTHKKGKIEQLERDSKFETASLKYLPKENIWKDPEENGTDWTRALA